MYLECVKRDTFNLQIDLINDAKKENRFSIILIMFIVLCT